MDAWHAQVQEQITIVFYRAVTAVQGLYSENSHRVGRSSADATEDAGLQERCSMCLSCRIDEGTFPFRALNDAVFIVRHRERWDCTDGATWLPVGPAAGPGGRRGESRCQTCGSRALYVFDGGRVSAHMTLDGCNAAATPCRAGAYARGLPASSFVSARRPPTALDTPTTSVLNCLEDEAEWKA